MIFKLVLGKGMFTLRAMELEMLVDVADGPARVPRGMLGAGTIAYFDRAASHEGLTFANTAAKPKQLMKLDLNLMDMGIGGLTNEFSEIFRRAFATRMFPKAVGRVADAADFPPFFPVSF